MVQGAVRKGSYFDSVTLMIAGRDVSAAPGIQDAAVVMGTPENRSILKSAGLWVEAFDRCQDTDLLIAIKAENESAASDGMRAAEERLRKGQDRAGVQNDWRPRSLESAIEVLPGANLALISVAGRYAGRLARAALQGGLHVMLFSDNVPLEQEIELKRFAHAKGLLVMGPDCGTAILNGVPLAFANAVNRGDIGIVAAAGTGLQEVSCLVSNGGGGISQAIGTGGRDVRQDVGGITFLDGLQALCEDEATRVIVLISKPPHESVLRKIGEALRGVRKPVIAVFLGADPALVRQYGMTPAETLEEAAALALGQAGPIGTRLDASSGNLCGRYVRGLFSGGTFCAEAQVIFRRLGVCGVFSNVPLPSVALLADAWTSTGHTLVDLGDDIFTVGRPHPMIDYSLRNRRILQEAEDPETALILLDVVLGYGSHPDPAGELAPVVREAVTNVAIVCSVTGTPHDPQNRDHVVQALRAAGARVFPSNAAACRFAAEMACRSGGH